MGSTRSPSSSTLDSTYYTQSLHSSNKHKSKRSSPPPDEAEQGDYDNNIHTSSSSRSKKKKKKSKKERHDHHNHHHSSPYDYNDNYHGRNGREDLEDDDDERSPPPPPPPPQQSTQTLPRIKISLKLLANPTIVPQPTSTTPTRPDHWSHSTSNRTSGTSKKKRRSSEQISVVSEDDEGEGHDIKGVHEYPYDDQHNEASPIPHKKKKKHKHKHKHRHPKHDDGREDEDDTAARYGYHHQIQLQQAPENDDRYLEESDDGNDVGVEVDSEDTVRSTNEAAKLTLRLGKMGKKKKSSSSSHRTHHHRQSEEMDQPTKARSRSRSVSQHVPVVVKQEEAPRQPYNQSQNDTHAHIGQKRPFSSLQSVRSVSMDTDMADQMTEDDHDDPLAGDLDEPEDYDDEEEEEEEDGEQDESEDEDMSSRAQYGSKSVKSTEFGSKTVPGTVAMSATKPKKPRKPKLSKDAIKREGSATAPLTVTTTTTTKSGRKGKASKRLSTPKTSTPTVPKKKELSVVCHKLLDHFVRKDPYDMFTQPVDPVLVPDYSSVIKNPMDLSTMRAKVERNFYPNIDEFLKDFKLVCDNARLYNAPETLYWRQANRLWEWGSKAIERERKSVLDKEEELLRTVKDEETLDIGGMGDYNNNHGHISRASVAAADASADSPMSIADSRSHTPQQYRKAKKIKLRRDGTIAFSYSTDGSIDPASHPDPWSLIPMGPEFGATPAVCPLVETNIHYNGQYLDDYPYWRAPTSVVFRPAHFQDYGPYAILEKPNATDRMNGRGGINTGVQNIPAYTGMVFGDEKGEAYVRSLAMFLDGIVDDAELAKMDPGDTEGLLQIKECVQKKVEVLTRGASTIVDKVAGVVREEKSGKLIPEIDARVPMTIWKKEFESEEEVQQASDVPMDNQPINESVDLKDVEMKDATEQESVVKVKDEPKDETMTEDVKKESKAGKPPPPEPEMIDIRQVVKDIKAWPELKNRRKDYTTWKALKIELNSLLPSSSQQQSSATATAEDEVQVKWGERWTGGDSEESKKWVREYLEQNSDDMRKVVQVLATKTSSKPASTTTTAGSDEQQENALVERLIKNIRKRLAEMVQYVPLSEINPQALPPPKMPATPTPASAVSTRATTNPAPTTAPSTTTASASQPSTATTASSDNSGSATATTVTTTANVSMPGTPGEGSSVSSLSSPGSASSP